MGVSGRKKIAGFNTSLQQRGLRVQKQIGLGPFRFNVGTYLGGTHHGRVTGRSQFGQGGLRWQKETQLNGSSNDFSTRDLDDVFDIDADYEDDTPWIMKQNSVLLMSLLALIAQMTLLYFFPLSYWIMIPTYQAIVLMILAAQENMYFTMYTGAKQIFVYAPFFGWTIVMTFMLLAKIALQK